MKPLKEPKAYKGMSKASELGDYADKLSQKLDAKLNKSGKIKPTLGKKKKSKIPGHAYWFDRS